MYVLPMPSPVVNDAQILIRLPSDVIDKLDELAAQMSRPGMKIARASVVRMLIVQGLESTAILNTLSTKKKKA